jgi:APA family basic amino acid/polyamine antiporter
MRKTHPEAERPFRCPWVPVVPICGVVSCLLLMFSLPAANWWRLGIWLVIGLVIYFSYSQKHSVVAQHVERASALPGAKRAR